MTAVRIVFSAREAVSAVSAAPRKVLVAEDDVLVRMMIAEELRQRAYAVIEAASADEALLIVSSGEAVDLVLTDIKMPGSMDGLGLAKALRRQWPRVKIVIVSGEQARSLSGSVTADALFGKPYEIEHILACIDDLIGPVTH